MLIDISYPLDPQTPINFGPTPPQDLLGILAVVNDLYERNPEKFGTPEIRKQLERDITHYVNTHDYARFTPKFYEFFVKELKKYKLTPFHDISLAFVGGWQWHRSELVGRKELPDRKQTIAPALTLLKQFKQFHDIDFHTKGVFLNTDNALTLIGGEKVDYVITGNVINAPDNHSNEDTILACANMLKKGGHVIHLLNCGQERSDEYPCRNIGNFDFYKLAGQKHEFSIPEGPYTGFDHFMWTTMRDDWPRTELMVFEQTHEVKNSPANVSIFNRMCKDYWSCLKEWSRNPHRDRYYNTFSRDAGFSDKAFYNYVFEHPERISVLGGIIPSDLNTRHDIGDWQKRAEFYLARAEGYGFSGLENMKEKKGKALSPQEAEEIVCAYNRWRDEMISKIAAEIAPETKRTNIRRASPREEILHKPPRGHHKPKERSATATR